MKKALKHMIAFGVILVLAVVTAAFSAEIYRIIKHPDVVKHEVLDFTIPIVFLFAFIVTTGALSAFWIWLQKRKRSN